MFDLNIEIKINLDKSKLKKPILIAGLPGMGLTGKQAVDYLIESLNAFKISEIKTPFLTAPAITTHDGIVDDMMSEIYTLYYAKSGDLDLILFTGATQPPSAEWQHLLSYRIVEELSKYGIEVIYTLAATPIFTYKWDAQVYGVATSRDLLELLRLHGVIPMRGEGMISGMNGLLVGYGKKFGINGAILLGETYLTNSRDYIAPLAVLRALVRILRINVDLTGMESLALEFHKQYMATLAKATAEKKTDKSRLGYIS